MSENQKTEAGERTQHTLGPWRAQESARGFQVNANGHEPGNSTVVATIHETAVYANEADHAGPDARLIAAAPELLESLREYVLLETSAAPYSASPMRLKANAAIAKAEGRS